MPSGCHRIVLLTAAVILRTATGVCGQEPAAADPRPYLRVVDGEDGVSSLEVAARAFQPPREDMPRVFLAGAVHIGDRAFYDELQRFLDAQSLVLFEGVKPAGAGAAEHDGELSDEAKAKTTERRIRFLAIAAEKYRADRDAYPASLEELADGLEARVGSLVRASASDAWGRSIEYTVEAPGEGAATRARPKIELISLGADGVEGGDGAGADLRFSAQKRLTRAERSEGGDGLQQQMAEAFGLVFQLDAMNHDGPTWRNSDMSIDQVQRRLDQAGAEGGALFTMLDGSSLMSRVAGAMVRLIGATATGRFMFKLMLVEMLSQADEILAMIPGDMGTLFEVLIRDRNAVVIADLERLIRDEPGVETVGIIYGAGHMPDLEQRLVALGYTPGGDTWRPAISVDPADAGMSKVEARRTRELVRSMLRMQLEQMKKMH